MIVPVPAGNWGLGPSLLYLIGVIAALAYLGWGEWRRRPREETKEQAAKREQAEAFTRALSKNRWNDF